MSTRVTPYELILESLEDVAFPAIRDEAQQRESDASRRDQFLLLGQVGATLKEIIPDDSAADALDEYAELLFHGFQFWSYGRRLYTLTNDVLGELLAPEMEIGAWTLAAPPSCYIQLPYQRVWSRVGTDDPFEPVDGFFLFVDDTEPAPEAGAHLRAQLVLGLREDRPGISLVSYRTDLDPRRAGAHARRPWRQDEQPFANSIPGGERKGYQSLATTAELEALAVRVLWYLDTHTRSLRARAGSAEDGATHLPYTEVHRPSGSPRPVTPKVPSPPETDTHPEV